MALQAVVFPILPGKTEQWRRFIAEMNGPRRAEYEARARLEESRALAERHHLGPLAASGLLRLAALDRLEGDYPRARARLEALRRSAALIGGPGGTSTSQDLLALELGSLARAEGRFAEARAHLHGALRRLHQRGEGALLRAAVCLAGLLEVARGEAARGVTLLGAGADGEGRIGSVHVPDVRAEAPGFLGQARQTLGEAAAAAAWAEGQAMLLGEAVAYALEDARTEA